MQLRHQRVEIGRFFVARQEVLDEVPDALLAAGNRKQLAVQFGVSWNARLNAGRCPSRSVSASVPSTSNNNASNAMLYPVQTKGGLSRLGS
jgi:hypothetical protein